VAQRLTFAYPGDLQTLTGGYLYDKRILEALASSGWDVAPISLGEGFPWPTAQTVESAMAKLVETPNDRLLVIDGLALGALGAQTRRLAPQHPYIALVHHPLARESGLSTNETKRLFESEIITLKNAQGVIVTSETTAQTLMADYEVDPDQLHVVIPGIDRPKVQPQSTNDTTGSESRTLHLLAVGAIVPRKGFDVLVRALHAVADRRWSLTIVGDPTRSPSTSESLNNLIASLGMGDRVTLVGSVSPDALAEHYRQADVFVLASHYEGYGMAYAEALSWGLPIIGTTGGAVKQTVPEAAGLLVPPGELAPLIGALVRLLDEPNTRQALTQAAREHGKRLPSWQDSGEAFARALTQLASQQ